MKPSVKKRAAAVAAMLCTATAHAQWVVIDPPTSCRTR